MDQMRKRSITGSGWIAALACLTLPIAITPAFAQDFYVGKQVNMLVGSGTGGGERMMTTTRQRAAASTPPRRN